MNVWEYRKREGEERVSSTPILGGKLRSCFQSPASYGQDRHMQQIKVKASKVSFGSTLERKRTDRQM